MHPLPLLPALAQLQLQHYVLLLYVLEPHRSPLLHLEISGRTRRRTAHLLDLLLEQRDLVLRVRELPVQLAVLTNQVLLLTQDGLHTILVGTRLLLQGLVQLAVTLVEVLALGTLSLVFGFEVGEVGFLKLEGLILFVFERHLQLDVIELLNLLREHVGDYKYLFGQALVLIN